MTPSADTLPLSIARIADAGAPPRTEAPSAATAGAEATATRTLKVCKVVLNSVSHDARVLKEAEAVRKLGHEVTIVGIQDANNRRPLDLLDNGVVIRRVAWNSAVLRPVLGFYALAVVVCLAAAIGIYAGFLVVRGAWTGWTAALRGLCTWENGLLVGLGAGALFMCWRIVGGYLERRASYKSASKRERDELLKYAADFERLRKARARERVETAPAAERPAAPAAPTAGKRRRQASWWQRVLPRPLMTGLGGILLPGTYRRWKTIWAREARIREVLREERPDIIHAHDVTALAVCAEHKRRFRCKLVFDAHEVYDHLAQSEDDLAEINGKVMRKHQDDADLFVTINESIGGYYRVHYAGFPKAVIVKNATPRAEPFAYDGRLHDVARLPRDRRILIYQGGYAPKRGLLPLLLSIEYLKADWTLVFMGWGRLETELRRAADALCIRTPALAERVRFVPKVPQKELPYWTAGAALGAIPYENVGLNHWFCTPNKLWEYPNAGVPIIASPFPELRRIIEPNGIGWFLPDPLSPKDIAAAINALTPEALSEARLRCRQFIDADNWSVYADRLQKAYRSIA